MTFHVPTADCRFTLQDISITHLFPLETTECEEGPIVVSRMNDGKLFVHNGRHRVIRALIAGQGWIEAVTLKEYERDV